MSADDDAPGPRPGTEADAPADAVDGARTRFARRRPDFASVDPTDPGFGSSVAGGLRWSLVALVGKQGARIGFTLILARLLGPYNFGVVAQATVYIALTEMLLDLGFAAAIIQRERLDRRDVGSAFWLNVGVGILLAATTLVAAPTLATFFRTPELTEVLRVLSMAFVLRGLAVVPAALLTRAIRFRQLGIAELASTIVGGVAGVVAAVQGAGYWALVVQTLVRDAIFVVALFAYAGLPAARWSYQHARGLWRYSMNVFGAQFVSFITGNADNLLVARVLGATPLAHYALSYRMLLLPVQVLSESVNRVTFPTFSRLQADPPRMASYFLRATRSLALLVVPAMTLVIVTAPLLVPTLFGPDWDPAIAPMQLLSFAGILTTLMALVGSVLLAAGRPAWLFRLSLLTAVCAITSFFIGVRWGIVGVAAGYTIVGTALSPLGVVAVGRLVPLTFRQYFRALAPAATSSLVLAAAAGVVIVASRGSWPDPVALGVATLVGAVAYVGATRVAWPGDFADARAMGTMVLRGAAADPSPAVPEVPAENDGSVPLFHPPPPGAPSRPEPDAAPR